MTNQAASVLDQFLDYLGPAKDVVLRDPERIRDASDRFAIALLSIGLSLETAERYARTVRAAYGVRYPKGRPIGKSL